MAGRQDQKYPAGAIWQGPSLGRESVHTSPWVLAVDVARSHIYVPGFLLVVPLMCRVYLVHQSGKASFSYRKPLPAMFARPLEWCWLLTLLLLC